MRIRNKNHLFVIGTGTNVGKTVFSSYFMFHFGKEYNWKYFKPIQTGKNGDFEEIQKNLNLESKYFISPVHSFPYPASPHYSASLESKKIDFNNLLIKIQKISENNVLIEAVGGLMVPLNDQHLFIEIIQKCQYPIILVCGTELGTINHSLLTIDFLIKNKLKPIGLVFVGVDHPLRENNIQTIQSFSKQKVLGEIILDTKKKYKKKDFELLFKNQLEIKNQLECIFKKTK